MTLERNLELNFVRHFLFL